MPSPACAQETGPFSAGSELLLCSRSARNRCPRVQVRNPGQLMRKVRGSVCHLGLDISLTGGFSWVMS